MHLLRYILFKKLTSTSGLDKFSLLCFLLGLCVLSSNNIFYHISCSLFLFNNTHYLTSPIVQICYFQDFLLFFLKQQHYCCRAVRFHYTPDLFSLSLLRKVFLLLITISRFCYDHSWEEGYDSPLGRVDIDNSYSSATTILKSPNFAATVKKIFYLLS